MAPNRGGLILLMLTELDNNFPLAHSRPYSLVEATASFHCAFPEPDGFRVPSLIPLHLNGRLQG